MSAVQKSITVTDQQARWIRTQIEAGRYTDESELIRDLVRREQERSTEIEVVRAALIDGELSGIPQPFDPDKFKLKMRLGHG